MFGQNIPREVETMRKKKEKTREDLNFVPEVVSQAIVTDPNGSYTGRPVDLDEKPIQDADDL